MPPLHTPCQRCFHPGRILDAASASASASALLLLPLLPLLLLLMGCAVLSCWFSWLKIGERIWFAVANDGRCDVMVGSCRVKG
jgi:hypothetical protein